MEDTILSEQWASFAGEYLLVNAADDSQVVPEDRARVCLAIANLGATTVYVGRSKMGATARGYPIAAGGVLKWELANHGALVKGPYFVWGASALTLYVTDARHDCACLWGGK
jgi:hypothetical protein